MKTNSWELDLNSSEKEIIDFCQSITKTPDSLNQYQQELYLNYGLNLLNVKQQKNLLNDSNKTSIELVRQTRNLAFATIALALFTLGTLIYQIVQANISSADTRDIASAQLTMKLDKNLSAPEFDSISTVIDDGMSSQKLSNKFSRDTLESYLSALEDIADFYDDHLLNEQMVYDEFSYPFEKTYCNVDMQNEIRLSQKEDNNFGPNAFYKGFQTVAQKFLNKDNKTCTDIDKE